MDTKSKKSKIIFSFLSFFIFLSISILACFVAIGYGAANSFSNIPQYFSDAFATDYQNTYQFKETIGSQLQNMIGLLNNSKYVGSVDLLDNDPGKNMLYQIEKVSSTKKYSNYNGKTSDLSSDNLPEGYNFRLYFDGKKVTVNKDGKAVDVYGNGTYTSNKGMWYVPGYSNLNFTDTDMENCRITILARKELAEPFNGRSSLYNILERQRIAKILIYTGGGVLLFGIILFVLYILFRKEKKQADLALARFSGWFWFEFKAFCLVCLIWLDSEIICRTWQNHWFNWGICIVISILGYYLVINDMRYTPQFYKHNIIHTVLKYYQTLETGKPFQKQMVQRFWALLGTEILLVLFFVIIVMLNILNSFSGPIFLLCLIAAMIYLIYRYVRRYQNTINDIGRLIAQISLVKSGDFSTLLELPANADLSKAACELNTIQTGFSTAVDERVKSDRMKIDLITNVSHDIKTPLTSIISYVDLLKQEDDLPEHIKDYIRVLAEKSDRLKNMVQDIFDVSKATSGNIELNMEELDLGKLLRQTLADMNEEIETSGLILKLDIPDSPIMISADGQRLYRVFQNLIGNALQYSLEGSRVFIALETFSEKACTSIKNISKFELDNQKDMTERFVRGDSSRSTSGSGLGLSISRSFTEACGGNFHISTDADLFSVDVEFKQIL